MDFKELGINDALLEGLDSMGIRTPTPIQEQAIPAALDGRDLIACAQTGTGKTAAFLLPLIDVIHSYRPKVDGSIRALIVVPTRELALQIDQQLQAIAYFTPIDIHTGLRWKRCGLLRSAEASIGGWNRGHHSYTGQIAEPPEPRLCLGEGP